MTVHIRRAIITDLKTKLLTLAGFAGVWNQRVGPTRNSYPCITLFAEDEQTQTLTFQGQPRPQDRKLVVSIKLWIRGSVDFEKAESDMDAAAGSVEGILSTPAHATDIQLISTVFEVAEEEPDIHAVTLTYSIDYLSTEFTPLV